MWKPKILRRIPKPVRLDLNELLHGDFVISTGKEEFIGCVTSVTLNITQWDPVFSKHLTIEIVETRKND